MAEIEVRVSKLKNCASNQKSIGKRLNTYDEQIRSCSRKLQRCLDVGSYPKIQNYLNQVSNGLEGKARSVESMGGVLLNVARTYQDSENRIARQTTGLGKTSYWGKKNSTQMEMISSIVGGSGRIIPAMMVFIVAKQMDFWSMWNQTSATKRAEGKIFGIDSKGEVTGSVLDASWGTEVKSGTTWKTDKETGERKLDNLDIISAAITGGASILHGKAKGNIGFLSGEVDAKVGSVSGKSFVKASLFKDGKLAPQLGIGGEARASALEGSVKGQLGSEDINAHFNADGKLATAGVKGDLGIGKINYEGANGKSVSGYGVGAQGGAEAYLATGKVSGGISILGVDVDVGVSGKAGGAGISAGGAVTTGGCTGSIGAGLGVGAGLEVSVDWTKAVSAASNVNNWVSSRFR